MKRIRKQYLFNLAAAGCLTVLFTVTGCDVTPLQNAADDFGVVIGLEEIETAPTVMVTDAKTGELVDSKITVSFDGPNGGDVIDIYSDPVTTQEFSGGIFNFGIDNALSPSANSPVEVQLNLEANGYVTRSAKVNIIKEADNEFEFSMVRITDPPFSVSTTRNQTGRADQNGSTQSEIRVASRYSDDPDSGGVELNIPQGTVFMDETGAPLRGQLRTELTNYDPTDPEALESFPFQADDPEVDGVVIAGISTIQISDESGRVASSSQVDVLNKRRQNKNNLTSNHTFQFSYKLYQGYQVSKGDLVSFYTFNIDSYSPYRYSFKRYDNVEVVELGNGNLGVQFAVESYPRAICVVQVIRRGEMKPATINVNRNGRTGSISGRMYAFGSYHHVSIPVGESSFTVNVPDINYRIYIWKPERSILDNWNFHKQGEAAISLPAPPAKQIDATVNVELACTQADKKVRITGIPGSSVTYRKVDAPWGTRWSRATNLTWNYDKNRQVLSGGAFNVSGVEDGESYRFKISFDGDQHEEDVTINGENFTYRKTIDDDICS